ncbi:MAG: ferritin family protein [Pseudomonadota bacterium]
MKDKIRSIELALENEIQERNFYLLHSAKTENPVGKRMFARIAEDEQEHLVRLQGIYKELSAQGRWPEHVSAEINNTDIMQFLVDTVRACGDTETVVSNDCDAIRIAIAFETKGYTFYQSLNTAAEAIEEKNFFSRMAAMEREHFLSLRETLLYLEDPAQWFFQQEKPGLEG